MSKLISNRAIESYFNNNEPEGHAFFLLKMALDMREPTPSPEAALATMDEQTRQFVVSTIQSKLGFNIFDTEVAAPITAIPIELKKDQNYWQDKFSRWEYRSTPFIFTTVYQQKALAYLEQRRGTLHPEVTHAEVLRAIGYSGNTTHIREIFRTTGGRPHPGYKIFIQTRVGNGRKGFIRLHPEVMRRPLRTNL